MAHTVGEVARIARVSVRALHHYDEIGLLEPSSRTEAGYRLYTSADLERLQQILFYRELGFPLDEIERVLADPTFDRRRALVNHRELLAARAEQARALVALVDRTIEALDRGESMSWEQMFDGFEPSEYEEEARERWGGSAEFEESRERTRRYSKDDWTRIKAESAEIVEAFAAAFDAGVTAADHRAMQVAERHRQHISRWFYRCTLEIHVGLGEMYVSDPRFTAHYDGKERPGLSGYIRDAIRANAERGARGDSAQPRG
jgi:DNA-binding transcriptional MerR regulator